MAPSLTVVFPAYNDAGTIADMVAKADLTARELTDDYEIIVVNDGSSDATQQVLDRLAVSQPRLRVIQHPYNRGYGGALRSGFSQAHKQVVFYTDGDAQYDPRELRLLWANLTPQADIVQGYKIVRRDPLHRVLIGKLYQRLVSRVFGLQIRDVDCDFRLIRRTVLEQINLSCDSGAICVELVKRAQQAGFSVVEVPVNHHPRRHGTSQAFKPHQVAAMLIDLARLWRETS